MGRGNWFPGNDLSECAVVYVDYSDDGAEPDDVDASQWRYRDFKAYLLSCLPPSFRDVSGERGFRGGRDDVAVAANGLFTLWIDGQGDDYHQGIGFTVNEDAPPFARSRLDDMARKVFDQLAQQYDLSVRCCAWTSGRYVPYRVQPQAMGV